MSPYQMDPLMKLLLEEGGWQVGNVANQAGSLASRALNSPSPFGRGQPDQLMEMLGLARHGLNQLGGAGLAVAGSLVNGAIAPGRGGLQGIGEANPAIPSPQFTPDPREPWSIGGGSGYDSGWLDKSIASRQAMYDAPTPIAPRQPLEATNPVLMGKETAGVSDIPTGNRMTTARRWSGMDGRPGGGLEADPLGATRMSQPVVGGAIGPDANDLARQAAAEKHQAEINALDAMSGKAAPLWQGLPSSKEEAFKALMAKGDPVSLYMAGNLNEDPLGRYGNPNAPVKFGEPGQRKYSDQRLADLNTRQKAVEDRARRKGEAREMRMGGGDALAMDKQMQMFQAMGGGGGGAGGVPDVQALIALYGPQVGVQIAEHLRLAADDRAKNERGDRTVAIQDRQTQLAEAEAAAMARDQIIKSLPPDMQKKPGLVAAATTPGGITDESVASQVELRKNAGQSREQIASGLIQDGYPASQVNYIIERLMPVAQQPSAWETFSAMWPSGEPTAPVQRGPRGVARISMGQ